MSIFPIISVGFVKSCSTSNNCFDITISAPKAINTDAKEKIIKLIIKEKLPFEFSDLFFTYLEKSPIFKITIEKKANNDPVIPTKDKRFSLEAKLSVVTLSLKALIISFELSPARTIINTARPV